MYAEFLWRLVFHDHRSGSLSTMTVFNPTTSRSAITFETGYHNNHVQFLRELEEWLHLTNYISFTDDAQFYCNSINNTRNSHSLSHNSPHEAVQSNFQ